MGSARSAHVVVFLDNTDRLSEDHQKLIYSFSHKLAASTGATVIVPLRESTYFRARADGFLDVRTSDLVFHLKSPDLVQVLAKRIRYVENQLSGNAESRDHRFRDWKKAQNWEDLRQKSLDWSATLKRVFLMDVEGSTHLSLLAAISWHNVRLFLDLLRRIHSQIGPGSSWRKEEMLAVLMLPSPTDSSTFIPRTLYRPISRKHNAFVLKARILSFLDRGVSAAESRRGVSHEKIMTFARSYGYRRMWITDSLTELVRERLLECLELPTEPEYTRGYKIKASHTFRVSPLAILLMSEVQFERIYLSCSGWLLPVHCPNTSRSFTGEASDTLGDNASVLSSEILDMLLGSELPEKVAAYILDRIRHEPVPSERLLSHHDMAATEERLREFRDRLSTLSPSTVLPRPDAPETSPSQNGQLSLFSEKNGVSASSLTALPLPKNFKTARLAGKSRNGALILWALATAKANGIGPVSGSHITKIINDFAVDDANQVEPTNISRCLRGPVMADEGWLQITSGPRKNQKIFALDDGWEIAWTKTFGEEAPLL